MSGGGVQVPEFLTSLRVILTQLTHKLASAITSNLDPVSSPKCAMLVEAVEKRQESKVRTSFPN